MDEGDWEPEFWTSFVLSVKRTADVGGDAVYLVSSALSLAEDGGMGLSIQQRRSYAEFLALDASLRQSEEFGPLINAVERPSADADTEDDGDATAAKLSEYLTSLQAHLGEELLWQCKRFLGFLDDSMNQPNLRDCQLTFLSRKVAELQAAYRSCTLKLYETEGTLSSIMHRLHYLDKEAEVGARGGAATPLEEHEHEMLSDDSRGARGAPLPTPAPAPQQHRAEDAAALANGGEPAVSAAPAATPATADAAAAPPTAGAEAPTPAPAPASETAAAAAAAAAAEAAPAVEATPLPRYHTYTSSKHVPEACIPTNEVADSRDQAVEAVLSLLWPREAQVSRLPHGQDRAGCIAVSVSTSIFTSFSSSFSPCFHPHLRLSLRALSRPGDLPVLRVHVAQQATQRSLNTKTFEAGLHAVHCFLPDDPVRLSVLLCQLWRGNAANWLTVLECIA
jgi:hypothetical protein